jgi:hypothetical protein
VSDSASPGATLRAAIAHAEITFPTLWVGYFALGGMANPDELRLIIDGIDVPSHYDYDLIAQTINETFMDQGGDHPVPYAEDIGL